MGARVGGRQGARALRQGVIFLRFVFVRARVCVCARAGARASVCVGVRVCVCVCGVCALVRMFAHSPVRLGQLLRVHYEHR